MSDFRILYPKDGGVAVVTPAPGITQEQAMNAVPSGSPYMVVDKSDLPADRTFRDAWEVDFSGAQVKP